MAGAMLTIHPHPLLHAGAFATTFPAPLGTIQADILGLPPTMTAGDDVRAAVRDLLRHGGFSPSGRNKPASEYLRTHDVPPINPAVDACNLVSRHSGLPISVIDLDRARAPFSIAIAPKGTVYVFNTSGQELDVSNLLCLHDADGPCANAVKDSQRTKTSPATIHTLSVVWGVDAAHTATVVRWYRSILDGIGARTEAW